MTAPRSAADIRRRIDELGPWFHNMQVGGVWTAPDHFLGDYPNVKWRGFEHAVPADLAGRSVLDIGCNGGFYAIEMKRRGAGRVLGVDHDENYLRQARFAAEVAETEIEFRRLSVYDVGSLGEMFDIVLFMGVLYHLRHPLLALDLLRAHVVGDLLVMQTMQRGSDAAEAVEVDYPITRRDMFDRPGYPKLHFIEHRYSGDPTNWWVPNRSCTEAMLRSAGFAIVEQAEEEVFVCRRAATSAWSTPVYPARGVSA